MASEEIKLVGSFKDKITPELKKLNKQIDAIGRSFQKFNRSIRPMAKEFGRVATASKTFNESLVQQRSLIQGSAKAMRDYKTQAGKMVSAMRSIQNEHDKMMRAQGISRAQQKRSARQGASPGAMPIPSAPAIVPKKPKRSSGKKGGAQVGGNAGAVADSAGRTMGMSFRNAVGATALGSMMGNAAYGILAKGLGAIKGVAMKPVNYLLNKWGDRVADEMADLKSAGGLMAIDMEATSKSGQQSLFNSVTDALQFQERLNIDAAKSAAALPGVTQQYVDVKRQLTDTVQLIMEQGRGEDKGAESREAFMQFGEGLGADISMGGNEGLKEAFSSVLNELTERTVLIGQGQQGGLPMHIFMQELLNKEVNNKGTLGLSAMTKKYRAAFKTNPMLKKFLIQAEEEMTKTGAGTVERLELVNEVLTKAMPVEVINKMRGTVSGMTEAFNSAFFDQQSGLFGLSRPVENVAGGSGKIKRAVNDLSENLFTLSEEMEYAAPDGTVKKFSKGTRVSAEQLTRLGIKFEDVNGSLKLYGDGLTKGANQIAEASMDQSYLYEVLRETLSGFGVPFLQLASIIPQVYDPFFEAVKSMMPLRDAAQTFNKEFLGRASFIEQMADEMAKAGNKGAANKLRKQAMTRGAITTLNDYLATFGLISEEKQKEINDAMAGDKVRKMSGKEIEEQNMGQFLPVLFEGLLQSKLVQQDIPLAVGQMIGSLVKAAGDFIIGMFDGFTGKNDVFNIVGKNLETGFFKAFEGGAAGFGDMFGRLSDIATDLLGKAISVIAKTVVPLIKEVLKSLFKALWNEGGALGKALTIGIPLAIGKLILSMTGLGAAANAAAGALARIAAMQGGGAKQMAKKGGIMAGAKAGMKGIGDFFMSDVNKLMADRAKNIATYGQKGGALKNAAQGLGIKGALGAGLKSGLKMGAVGGILKAIMALFEGKSPLDAISEGLASAGGAAIGAAIGTIIFPGIGTVIGSVIGGFIGEMQPVIDFFKGMVLGLQPVFEVITGTIGGAISGIVDTLGSVFNILTKLPSPFSMILGLINKTGEPLDAVHAGMVAIKAVFAPIVLTLQLVEMTFRALAIVAGAVEVALTGLISWVANSFAGKVLGMDGEKAQKDYMAAQSKLTKTVKDADEAHKRNLKYFTTEKLNLTGFKDGVEGATMATEQAAKAMEALQDRAKAAGSTFENNKKFTGADGKEYGWAMKDGKKILVEWGSVLGDGVAAAQKFTEALTLAAEKEKQAREALASPVENGKVTAGGGMDQETADLINRLRAGNVHPTSSSPSTSSESGKPTAPTASSVPPEATEAMTQIGRAAQTAAPPLTEMAPKITGANTGLATIPASSQEVVASLDAANSALLGFVGELAPIPEQVSALLMGAATTAGTAITAAAQGLASALSSAASSIKNAASASASTAATPVEAGTPYDGHIGGRGAKRTLPLAEAIAKERSMMPSGADLMIANTSETVIPAFDGHMGDGFKGLSFAELESAAGFDRMKTYTEQIAEVADKTAAEFMGGMGGALGGGSATLNAMEALGNSMGLTTTSGFRPGDPGFHGVNRARDLSNGGGETPEMNKVANIMATKYGQSLTELIYTPLGYSIKNGQKTGLISPSNHYHHIHVAVAEGLAKAAVFNSQKAAESYERSMMPAGSEPMKVNLASMTANSSEFGGGGVTIGDVNVTVSGVDDPKAIANQVAQEILDAVQRATFTELYTS